MLIACDIVASSYTTILTYSVGFDWVKIAMHLKCTGYNNFRLIYGTHLFHLSFLFWITIEKAVISRKKTCQQLNARTFRSASECVMMAFEINWNLRTTDQCAIACNGRPLRTRRALVLCNDVPLRTKRALVLCNDVPLRTKRALVLCNDVPLRTKRALVLCNDVPLRTRRALMHGFCTMIAPFWFLKALFNNVFALKNLSCMALHAISVFGKV